MNSTCVSGSNIRPIRWLMAALTCIVASGDTIAITSANHRRENR
ncbi:MAG: hypothetical protein WBA57_11445 [Elainellaceae cyanobacterium]